MSNRKRRIITINVPEDYLDRMDDLIDLNIYQNRSDIVRIALKRFVVKELEHSLDLERKTFLDLMRHDPRKKSLKKKRRSPSPRKPMKKEEKINPHLINYEFKQLTQPRRLYKIFHGELYFNHVISHLAEREGFVSYETLAGLLGVKEANTIIYKLDLKAPGLLIRGPEGCKLKKKKFEKLMKEVKNEDNNR